MTDDTPSNWQTNSTSELGALLYSLFGPFSRISPKRKRTYALCERLDGMRPGTRECILRNSAEAVFVVRWMTSTCHPDTKVYLRSDATHHALIGSRTSYPTWKALTGGGTRWLLAEPFIVPPNASIWVTLDHPHADFPLLIPEAPVEFIAHGFKLDLQGLDYNYTRDLSEALSKLEGKSAAETKAFLDELLEQARRLLKEEPK